MGVKRGYLLWEKNLNCRCLERSDQKNILIKKGDVSQQ
jgi:hypothetical protein